MSARLMVSAVVGTMVGLGCVKIPTPRGKGPRVKDVQVRLPPRPNLVEPAYRERYPDGALTVPGFIREARKMGGKRVTVRGRVAEVVSCPKEARVCPTVPHLELAVPSGDSQARLLVVSNPPQKVLAYSRGQVVTLSGEVVFWSPDGRLIDLSGMLLLEQAKQENSSSDSRSR